MANLKERLPTRSAASGTSEQPSPEQTLLSRTQELQSVIANLKDELSETQKLNQTLKAENQQLKQENDDLSRKYAAQECRLKETEQTIRDLEDEIDKLRDEVDIGCIEAVRRARMEMLIMRNGAERKVARQRQEHEAEIQKLSADCRRQIDAVRKESENSKVRNRIAEGILLLLVVILASILCI